MTHFRNSIFDAVFFETVAFRIFHKDIKTLNKFQCTHSFTYYAPAPRVGALGDDARLTSV